MSSNPLQPTHCEKHDTLLVRKLVYSSGNRLRIGDPEPAEFAVGMELPHYLWRGYTEIPDEYHTEAIEVLFCEICQSEYPEKLVQARKHLAEREVELEKEVTGYFQLSALAEYKHLKEIVDNLRDEPSIMILERLRTNGLRWQVGSIKRGRAEIYQRKAAERGIRFIID